MGVYGKSLCFLIIFAVNLKCSKIKSIFKKAILIKFLTLPYSTNKKS